MACPCRRIRLALFATIGLAAAAPRAPAQSGANAKNPDAVLQAIHDHFQQVVPELDRHHKTTTFGETLARTQPTLTQKRREVDLMADAAAAGLLATLPDELVRLGHNLIVHEPAAAESWLRALHDPKAPFEKLFDERVRGVAVIESVAAGEQGEKLAVAELDSEDPARRAFWSEYLMHYAIYASSREGIEKAIRGGGETSTRAALVRALARIGAPEALPLIRELLAGEKDDEILAAAIFAFTELAGFDGRLDLEAVKAVGKSSTEELATSRDWLQRETRADLKHGSKVSNDPDFAERFADLPDSNLIRWMKFEHLLDEGPLAHPKLLNPARKKELLARLVDAKGFGLEAVKGALLLSLEPGDEAALLRIREVSYFSPNALSTGRENAIGILVRALRHGK